MLLLDIFRGQFIPCFFRIYFFYQNFVCSYNHLNHMQKKNRSKISLCCDFDGTFFACVTGYSVKIKIPIKNKLVEIFFDKMLFYEKKFRNPFWSSHEKNRSKTVIEFYRRKQSLFQTPCRNSSQEKK